MNPMLRKASDRFNETTIDDEIVVMSLETGDFFSLTGTGREIWQMLDGTRDRAGLLADLSADYAVDPAVLAGDVDAFLAGLAAAGLLDQD